MDGTASPEPSGRQWEERQGARIEICWRCSCILCAENYAAANWQLSGILRPKNSFQDSWEIKGSQRKGVHSLVLMTSLHQNWLNTIGPTYLQPLSSRNLSCIISWVDILGSLSFFHKNNPTFRIFCSKYDNNCIGMNGILDFCLSCTYFDHEGLKKQWLAAKNMPIAAICFNLLNLHLHSFKLPC